jgi:prophage regulatory protein
VTESISTTPRLLGKSDVLMLLGISDRTLEKLVRSRRFPPPLRLGKTVRWAASVVEHWLDLQLQPQRDWEPQKRASRALPRN